MALKEHFGGVVIYRRPGKEGWKPQWRWRVNYKKARDIIVRLRPYLITKAHTADKILSHAKERGLI